MIITKPSYYDAFHCIAGDCPDTCCANWEVVIDPDSLRYYAAVPGSLGAQLKAAIVETDGEPCFGLHDGLCRLLRPDGLCPIQKELGEEHLCKTCAKYPRFSTEIGLRRELGISLSCPEAARLMLSQAEPVTLVRETTDEPMQSLHELSPELLIAVDKLRTEALALAQNRTMPFPRRCAAIARLCAPVHAQAKAHHDRQLSEALEEGIFAAQTEGDPASKNGIRHFQSALQGAVLEPLHPQWGEQFTAAMAMPLETHPWEALCPEMPNAFENLLCYGICKYFPRAVFDRNIWSAALFAMAMPLFLRQLLVQTPGDVLPLAWNLSREIEHSEDNMATLWQTFSRRALRPEAAAAVFSAL